MDAAAFSAIVAQNRGRLVGYARGIVGRDRSEDVVQTALLRAWEHCLTGAAVLEPVPWLFQIVRHTALNVLRSAPARHDVKLTELLASSSDVAGAVEARDELARALVVVRDLPPRQRTAIMWAAEGAPPRAIAGELGLTSGAVRVLLHRGRAEVRARCPA